MAGLAGHSVGREVHVLEEIPSTNDLARDLGMAGHGHGLVERGARQLLRLGCHFEGLSHSHEQLIQAKNQSHFSIGSCSLHEPDHDLTRLISISN